MIIKLGICDDNMDHLLRTEFLVEDILDELKHYYEIKTFSSPRIFREFFKDNPHFFDIIILDIVMPSINGLELGKAIRSKDDHVIIIYLTSHAEHSLEAYDTLPFHFLVKPVNKAKLKEVLFLALARRRLAESEEEPKILVKFNHIVLTVVISDLLYIEKMGNACVLCKQNDRYKTYTTLKELDERIRKASYNNFIQCHQSYLINLSWVWKWEKTMFHLKTGEQVPISRKYRMVAEKAFKKYFEGEIL